MRYKNKTNSARRPPKILILGPPCSRKYEIAEMIAKKFNIIHVSTSDLLNKELLAHNDNSATILNCLNSGELVPDKYVFKLLEDRLCASDCMINGWILTGFPKTASQLHYLDQINPTFKPSLIVIIEHDFKTVEERSSMRRIDPITGKVYYINAKDFSRESLAVANRLVTKTEDLPEVFRKR
jgi:adenylate kinase